MIDGARILVVEDDAAINKVVCSYLGKLGAECVPAFSGTEGLMHLEGERRFDLLHAGAGEHFLVDCRRCAPHRFGLLQFGVQFGRGKRV